VHLAGVYTGDKLVLYVDGVKQTDEKAASGEVKEGGAVLRLGGLRCDSKMEECRISNAVRSTFGGSQAVKETVLRSVFWNGWRVAEERERTAEIGQQLGEEKLTRQFVDSAEIDEHLCVDIYGQDGASVEKTYWFHQNHRGDTVALTDKTSSVVKRYAYSTYGEPFEVDDNGNLSPVEDFSFGRYYFQGRELDEETGLYHFRNRMFNLVQGRFSQRDSMEYKDSMGLYEAFHNSPYIFGDPFGLQSLGARCAKIRCDDWLKTEPDPKTWADLLPPCPCKIKRENIILDYYSWGIDLAIWAEPSWHPFLYKFHHGASYELRSYPPPIDPDEKNPPIIDKRGQQCCYDFNGDLITWGHGAGTPDRVSPLYKPSKNDESGDSHWDADVQPWFDCINGYGEEEGLKKYHEKRPPNNALGCTKNPK
ncbi:MAG: RHS repeat-associated core domain-containing protein, partial [Nitrospirota bacterium]